MRSSLQILVQLLWIVCKTEIRESTALLHTKRYDMSKKNVYFPTNTYLIHTSALSNKHRPTSQRTLAHVYPIHVSLPSKPVEPQKRAGQLWPARWSTLQCTRNRASRRFHPGKEPMLYTNRFCDGDRKMTQLQEMCIAY